MTEKKQPWEWSESEWRALVGRVRAGRSYCPDRWLGGARCAVGGLSKSALLKSSVI